MVPDSRRLDSWKEIADYLRRGITTVQRWEREEGLPVRRLLHNAGGSVFAETADIDRWLRDRSRQADRSDDPPEETAGVDASALDVLGGAVPLDSPYYIERPADADVHHAVAQRAGLVLVKGARQVGKSSLLARALDRPRRAGARVAFTDVQSMSRGDLESAEAFFQALGRSLADQIGLRTSIHDFWNPLDSPNTNFSRYVQRIVVGGAEAPLVWGLDEVDRLVGCDYAVDVYSLFRSWHNRRALDPLGPWRRLTLVLAYATEAHLLIADLNQSPFNVGIRIALDDFARGDVLALHERLGSPLASEGQRERFFALVGGHPFLVQSALHAMRHGTTLDQLEQEARRGTGPLADHLRRVRLLVIADAGLRKVMQAVIAGEACTDRDAFYRLRSAGVITGDAPEEARPRCGLYAAYLQASGL
jgi:hypothetical protein